MIKYDLTKPPLGSLPSYGHPLAQGLVGLWLMNEGAGDKVYDLSGNGNTGTFVSDPIWSVGKFGPTIYCDGGVAYLDCGAGSSLNFDSGSQDFSVVVWQAFDNPAASNHSSVSRLDGGNDGWIFRTISGVPWLSLDSKDVKAATAISDTGYHCLAVTIARAGNGQVYIDGIASGNPVAIASEAMVTTANTRIGGSVDGHFCLGNISHVYIYNRALSASEIQELYREPFCMFDRDPIELWSAATLGAAAAGTILPQITNAYMGI